LQFGERAPMAGNCSGLLRPGWIQAGAMSGASV
jgi:hypothetical protein